MKRFAIKPLMNSTEVVLIENSIIIDSTIVEHEHDSEMFMGEAQEQVDYWLEYILGEFSLDYFENLDDYYMLEHHFMTILYPYIYKYMIYNEKRQYIKAFISRRDALNYVTEHCPKNEFWSVEKAC